MDADLQHDPKYIPEIAKPILEGSADFVMGSRSVEGAKVSEDWPIHRKIISWGATSLARPLTSAGDPMSGFFSISRKTFKQGLIIFALFLPPPHQIPLCSPNTCFLFFSLYIHFYSYLFCYLDDRNLIDVD